jgi:ABC-2 type transport system permease protein
MLLQYRSAALAGIGTQVFFGFVRVVAFEALYASSPASQPLTLGETRAYIWLSQAFLLVGMIGVDAELAVLIRTGNVAYELTRPVDLHAYWLARMVSGRVAPMLLRVLPILAFAALIGQLGGPRSLASLVLAALSMVLAIALSAAMISVLTISLLWTISGEGVARLAPALIYFLSGLVIPLPLMPEWSQPVLALLPFRGLMDVPFRIYLGDLAGMHALSGVVLQVTWTIALVLLGRHLVARGLSRLVVQGG